MTAMAMAVMTGNARTGVDGIHFAGLLARVAASKDREAFSEVFDHFAPRVKSFMMRKGAPSEQAEDLVQETMIAVWSKAALYYADRGSVSTWIFTIARNLRIDRLRRERSNLYTDMDDFDAPSDDPGQEEAFVAKVDGVTLPVAANQDGTFQVCMRCDVCSLDSIACLPVCLSPCLTRGAR